MAGDQSAQANRVSTVLGRKLGGELLRLRTMAGLTQVQAANAITASNGKVAKMESGWVPMREPDIRTLCMLYGASDPATVGRLLELARIDRERRKAKGWWNDVALSSAMQQYAPLEAVATEIKAWQVAYIPGLLQTAAYVRALRRSWLPDESPDEAEKFTASRLARQQRLSGESPLLLRAVIPEAALRIPVVYSEMLREQLESLLAWGERPNVTVQVLPFSAGFAKGLTGSFNVLSFAEPGAMDVVYVESSHSHVWVEGGDGAAQHVKIFEETARRALSEPETRAFIEALIKEL
ncbi:MULTISPECIES: helix-turn-helix transcriptional regulator [unclassified Streptomyces]|uniref:helix-turn-helix domain-containing protein n=1 Tax=unclassified Streptomyces TaxID=2593676 RepID=UPI00110FA8CB|nr:MULTISPECIES: helix-turn-helix transcriptional regulator [unclassified Streptomyces]MCG0284719.1 helix-turn-helix domain-containing protein [Streptomyces sp. PSAA01]TMU88877.1 helix-turn-helix domain-containing protein [Streptomyces sp. DASNCL29]